MPRDITPAMLAWCQSGFLNGAFLVSMQFKSETLNLWSGLGPLTYNSITYSGLGSILGIGVMEEGSTVEARGISILLSGLDPNIVPEIMEDYLLGGEFSVQLAGFSGGNIIASPIEAWAGRMDRPKLPVSGKTASIDIAMETRLLDMNIMVGRRRSNDDQQQLVPGDLGFSFVAGIQNVTVPFGTTYNVAKNL